MVSLLTSALHGRGKTEYENFHGNAYAQVAISTKVGWQPRSQHSSCIAMSIVRTLSSSSSSSTPTTISRSCIVQCSGGSVPYEVQNIPVPVSERAKRSSARADRGGCVGVQDVYKSAEQIKAAGGKITREPGPIPGINTKILATTDPDGWKYVLVDEQDFLNELK